MRYIGKVVCPRCGEWGYAEEGRIMGSKVLKVNHRRKVDGENRYRRICYV